MSSLLSPLNRYYRVISLFCTYLFKYYVSIWVPDPPPPKKVSALSDLWRLLSTLNCCSYEAVLVDFSNMSDFIKRFGIFSRGNPLLVPQSWLAPKNGWAMTDYDPTFSFQNPCVLWIWEYLQKTELNIWSS